MLLSLSTKFRRHIAIFLYGVLYSQFIMAAGDLRLRGPVYVLRESAGRVPRGGLGVLRLPEVSGGRVDAAAGVAGEAPAAGSALAAGDAMFAGANEHKGKVGKARELGGGPTQPEMQAYQSVNSNNMVDLFSGDFSYNIPLLDVGGYPVNIAYHSGISMDEDASWVGLGWNINPGSITRNMRGFDPLSWGIQPAKCKKRLGGQPSGG